MLSAHRQARKLINQKATANIQKAQRKYVQRYAQKFAVEHQCPFKVGDRVQYRNTANDKRMGGKFDLSWFPGKGFHVIKKILFETSTVILRKARGKSDFKTVHINNIRLYKEKKKKKRELIPELIPPPKKSYTTKSGRNTTTFDFS